jgi:hypothetical protein
MAAISIIEKNGLFTIELDRNEWTGLNVDGTPVQEGATGWKYVQTSKGTLNFVASASLLTTINPNTDFALEGENGEDYRCELVYSDTSAGAPFTMTGTLSTGQNIAGAQKGPIAFSQGMMAGGFGTVRTQIFRLTAVSQNDPGTTDGENLSATVTGFTGGKLQSISSPINEKVSLPIPPPEGHTGPKPPTWFMELDGSTKDASFTVEISGPAGYTPTTIVVKGSDMANWIATNHKEKTNQIYAKGTSGIFGFAQEDDVVDGNLNWIYSITGGVVNPMVHPPGVTA